MVVQGSRLRVRCKAWVGVRPRGRGRIARWTSAPDTSPRVYIAFTHEWPIVARKINRIILKLRVVPFGTVLDSRTTTAHNCEAVRRRARIQGS